MRKAYFISDLHLGAGHMADDRLNERRAVAFLDSIKDDASELYLLGDILDYWYEYKHVVPRGYVRFFGKLAELADSGVKITWLIGNHDIWIFDYIPSELGVEVIDGTLQRDVLGTRFEMEHGDAIGGNFKFRVMRSVFRNRFCQWLYAGLHPRLTVGFAKACSRRSRLKKGVVGECPKDLFNSIRDHVVEEVENGNPSKYFIYGHLHYNREESVADGRKLIILGAWITSCTYGVFDGENFRIKTFDQNT